MHVQFPELVTVIAKKNVKLGDQMEVSTLHCTHYHRLKKSAEKSLTLAGLGSGNIPRNMPQWSQFERFTEGKLVVLWSYWDLDVYWPINILEEYRLSKRKQMLELSACARYVLPGVVPDCPEELTEVLAEFVRQDDQYADDPILKLLIDLSSYTAGISLNSLGDASILISTEAPSISEWMARLLDVSVPRIETGLCQPDNIRKSVDIQQQSKPKSDEEHIRHLFSTGGPASQIILEYESRPEQLEYAIQLARALERRELFVAEAGTGTGKSLAYLIPLLLADRDAGKKLIVATHTKNLQNQLFYKDLPQAQEIAGDGGSSLLLKGRSNYLCLLRMHIARTSASRLFDAEQLAELGSVLLWKDITRTGDLSELDTISPAVRREVRCDPGFCPGSRCAHYSRCFLFRARRAVAETDIIVTNHSLFFSDALSDSEILGRPSVIAFDEAHQLERAATDALTGEISRASLNSIFEPLDSEDPGVPDRLTSLAGLIARYSTDEGLTELAKKAVIENSRQISRCREQIRAVFECVAEYVTSNKLVPEEYPRRERLVHRHELLNTLKRPLEELVSTMSAIGRDLTRLIELADLEEPEFDDIVLLESVQSVVTGIREYQGYLERLLNSEQHEWVKWLEIHSSGWFALKVAPCNIGKYMKDQLYGRYDRVVFTSATLAVDGEFDFVEDRLGLADVPAENKRLRVFGSSFDFTSQVEFTCAAFLPSPKSEMYQSRLAGFLKKLLRDIRLSTLILFTSYRSLQQTASELEGSVQNLVVQKGTGTADSATREFVRLKPAVLLGTESFWQGVDLPGDLLEMLIITRLPFAVPGEPIDSARMEEIEKRGINSFAAYSLPQAVIRFKQGFGRLIRTSHDTGSIIVTDNRLVKSTFGQVFLNSVPAQIGISSSFEELRDKVLRRSSMVI